MYYTNGKSRNNNMMKQCLKSYAWNHVQTDIREACSSNSDDNSKQTKSVWGKQNIVLKVWGKSGVKLIDFGTSCFQGNYSFS